MRKASPDRRELPGGIRLQATVIAAAVVAIALVGGALLLVLLVYRSLVGSLDAAGQARARDVAALAQSGRLQPTVATSGEESSIVQVVDRAGTVVAASSNIAGEAPMLARPPARREAQVFTVNGLAIANQQDFRVAAEPVTLASGPGWVYVATSLAQVSFTTERVALLLALGLPLLLFVVAAATWRAVGRALRPVELIRVRTAGIGGAEPGARVPVPGTRDEIARLAETMNAMLARIDNATRRQREFVGDASHELRSPLAALQTEIDVALEHPGSEPPAALLTRLSGQAARMGQLIDALLFLARADEGAAAPTGGVPVDLDELLLAEAQRLRTAGLSVRLDGPDAARVDGSATDLARLLRNLGDNALAHARSTATLGLRVEGEEAVLTVADDGPGVPAADRDRVFERFTRLDSARARPAGGGGSGLGLAICRQITDRHGGRIRLADGGPGARFVVRLPLSGR